MKQRDLSFYHEIVAPSKRHPIMVYHHATGLDYCAKHWHRSLEVCCYINTSLTLWENGVQHDLEPDALIIINSGDVHGMMPKPNEHPRGVSLIFPHSFMLQYEINIDHTRFTHTAGEEHDRELRQALHTLSDLWLTQKQDPYYYLLSNSEIFRVLYLLMSYYQIQDSEETPLLYHMERCRQILSYIDVHYADPITLNSVANDMNLSVGYLSRYFQKYLGTTFKQHLTSVRLQHAVSELGKTDKTMLSLSLDCGFPDYRSFISAFRKWYKITPYQYLLNHFKDITNDPDSTNRPKLVFSQHIPTNYE